jgi:hypothetical protein
MNAADALRMLRENLERHGETVSWTERAEGTNSRGRPASAEGTEPRSAKVLMLKSRRGPYGYVGGPAGLTQDCPRYIYALPETGLRKDTVLTDGNGDRWRLGPVDTTKLGGTAVALTAGLTRVE